MPTPLPDSVSATLRSDSTAALAALMVIAGAHAELFSWAARMVCDATPARVEPPPPKRRKGRRSPARLRQTLSPNPTGPPPTSPAGVRRAIATTRISCQAMRDLPEAR